MTSPETGNSDSRYVLIELIRVDGQAADWKALDRHTGGWVAIKTLAPDLDEAAFAAIEKAWRRLVLVPHHPHVVGVLDTGRIAVDGRPTPFLSLPLTAGRTLAEWNAIERRKLQPSDVVEVISQVAKGVAALHEAGVAHVDLKPDNILLWDDLSAKVADFGFSGSVGAPSDVWALGVSCYELLSGSPPSNGETVLDPRPLGVVIQKAMAKQPGERYATVAEFVGQLKQAFRADPQGRGLASELDKSELLARRELLLDTMFSGELSVLEKSQLDAIEHQLEEIETAEADEFDRGYPESRAGKIEAALDRLEASIRATQTTRYRTA